MTHAERRNLHRSHLDLLTGLQIGEDSTGSHTPQILLKITAAVKLQRVLFRQHTQTADMVLMLVGEKDTRQGCYTQATLRQSLADAQSGNASIYQHMGATAGNDGSITTAATGQHGKPNHDLGATGFSTVSSGFSALAGMPYSLPV